jgi:hypothetical protein
LPSFFSLESAVASGFPNLAIRTVGEFVPYRSIPHSP